MSFNQLLRHYESKSLKFSHQHQRAEKNGMKWFLDVLSVSFIIQRKLINNTIICLEALRNTR